MIRPLVVGFILYLTGLVSGSYAPVLNHIGMIGLIWFCVCLLVLWKSSDNRYSTLITGFIFSSFVLLGFCQYQHTAQSLNHQREVVKRLSYSRIDGFTARVTDNVHLSNQKMSFVLDQVTLQKGETAIPFDGKFILDIRRMDQSRLPLYGDRIWVHSKIWYPYSPGNPGAFDYREYLRVQGISGIARCSSGEIRFIDTADQPRWTVSEYIFRITTQLRYFLVSVNQQYLTPAYAGLANGIALGVQTDIPDEIQTIYRYGGIYHLLVVSGGNVMMVAGIAFMLLRLLRFTRPHAKLLCIPVIWFYAFIVGFSPPVFRASVMGTMLFLCWGLERNNDAINSLAVSGFIILLLNPMTLWNTSFQLSFITLLGILLITPILNFLMSFKPVWLRFSLTSTLGAIIMAAPVMVIAFNYLSPIALLSNLFAIPLVMFSLPMSFISGVCEPFFPWLADAVAQVNGFSLYVLTRLTEWLISLPGAYWTIPTPSGATICIYYLLVFGFIHGFQPEVAYPDFPFRRRWLRCCIIFAAYLVLVFTYRNYTSGLDVSFIDVGQGDCIFVQFPNGRNLLIDGGKSKPIDCGKSYIIPYLRRLGVDQLDTVVMTHGDEDHAGGLATVLQQIPTRYLLLTEYELEHPQGAEDIIQKVQSGVLSYQVVKRGTFLSGFEPWQVECLNPPAVSGITGTGSNENNHSIVLKITDGQSSLLFTGDIEKEAEQDLIRNGGDLSATVLKVSHHGSANSSSSEFLEKVHPRYAVIQVGFNNVFGHPSAETLQRLKQAQVEVFRTDRDGAVILHCRDGQLQWEQTRHEE